MRHWLVLGLLLAFALGVSTGCGSSTKPSEAKEKLPPQRFPQEKRP